jgi:hypothetical protein
MTATILALLPLVVLNIIVWTMVYRQIKRTR